MADIPLVVDLDGSLCRSDLLHESATAFVAAHPLQLLRLPQWLAHGGRARLKAELAARTDIDVSVLPYHPPLLAWLREQKAAGRPLLLATASDRRLAERVAAHLGLFDAVLASDGRTNLKGAAKRDALVERFGERGFDYVGNDRADLAIWSSARQAVLVAPSARLRAAAERVARVGRVFDDTPAAAAAWARAMRLHQWLKNLLLFVPLLAAHRVGDAASLGAALLAFVAFGLCASSVYLLNDLLDVGADRHHGRKCRRPFASGALTLAQGWRMMPLPVLAAAGLTLAWLPASFGAALATYFALTVAYSFVLKGLLMVDVLALALLYTMRIIAGALAIGVPLSFWLLCFSMFFFLSLALLKRYAELHEARRQERAAPLRGRGYAVSDLDMVASLGAASGYLSVLVLALYIQDPASRALYATPYWIWAACPILLYWVSRCWMLAQRGQMHDDPMLFAVRDRGSLACGALLLTAFMLTL